MQHNTFFNADWYLATNPDVAAAVATGLITAEDHFFRHGLNEGRSPSPLFDSSWYLQRYPDVADAVRQGFVTAFDHFIVHGQYEGRSTHVGLDMEAYLLANPDVAAAVERGEMSAMAHLLRHGVGENRDLGNGVQLPDYHHDPVFLAALENNDMAAALQRVVEVAPFMPGFVVPDGWTMPADTPIPVDFVPPPGMLLRVPVGVKVPSGVVLPDTFEKEGADRSRDDGGSLPVAGKNIDLTPRQDVSESAWSEVSWNTQPSPAMTGGAGDDNFYATEWGTLGNSGELLGIPPDPVGDWTATSFWPGQDALDGKGGRDTLHAKLGINVERMEGDRGLSELVGDAFASPQLKSIEAIKVDLHHLGWLDLSRTDNEEQAIEVTGSAAGVFKALAGDELTAEFSGEELLEQLSLFALSDANPDAEVTFKDYLGAGLITHSDPKAWEKPYRLVLNDAMLLPIFAQVEAKLSIEKILQRNPDVLRSLDELLEMNTEGRGDEPLSVDFGRLTSILELSADPVVAPAGRITSTSNESCREDTDDECVDNELVIHSTSDKDAGSLNAILLADFGGLLSSHADNFPIFEKVTLSGDAPLIVLATGADDMCIDGSDAGASLVLMMDPSSDGDHTIKGGRGDDILIGSLGNDRIYGGEGDNILSGGGNDALKRASAEIVVREAADADSSPYGVISVTVDATDMLTSGTGADTFVHAGGTDLDVLQGFELGVDEIILINHDDAAPPKAAPEFQHLAESAVMIWDVGVPDLRGDIVDVEYYAIEGTLKTADAGSLEGAFFGVRIGDTLYESTLFIELSEDDVASLKSREWGDIFTIMNGEQASHELLAAFPVGIDGSNSWM